MSIVRLIKFLSRERVGCNIRPEDKNRRITKLSLKTTG